MTTIALPLASLAFAVLVVIVAFSVRQVVEIGQSIAATERDAGIAAEWATCDCEEECE